MKRYLLHCAISIGLGFSLVLVINLAADPYAIFGTPIIPGFNSAKPVVANNSRIFKIAGYIHKPMDALILGTSRAMVGLNPKHRAFRNLHTYNMAMAGQPNTESARIFRYVATRNRLKTAVIGLDFFASNIYLPNPNDASEENFEPDRKLKLLLSFDTLKASKKTFFKNGHSPIAPNSPRTQAKKKFSRRGLIESEKYYMWGGTYLPLPKCRFAFELTKGDIGIPEQVPPLEKIRELIALSHYKNVDLKLFISPSHARQWEVLAALGLWEQWEEWKQQLVKINEEEAQRFKKNSFSLLDFSGYNSITTENLPDDPNTDTFGYVESSHYKPIIGDFVLDRLYGLKNSNNHIPEDFGIRITSANIASHLSNIRANQAQYRKSHPRDIAEIDALARSVKAQSRCPRIADALDY